MNRVGRPLILRLRGTVSREGSEHLSSYVVGPTSSVRVLYVRGPAREEGRRPKRNDGRRCEWARADGDERRLDSRQQTRSPEQTGRQEANTRLSHLHFIGTTY
jgi:hypothetical protein